MTVDVLTYGESMGLLDSERLGPLRLGGPMRLSIAGAESTVAIGVARLGGTARWVGVVGDDEVGHLVTRVLRAEGVDTDGVIVDATVPTSVFLKERRSASVTRVRYYRRGNAGSRLAPEHVREDDIADARILHVTGITPALSASAHEAVLRALEHARGLGVTTSVDLNYRAGLWRADEARPALTDLVKLADIVLATAEETALLTGTNVTDPAAAAEQLGRGGPRLAVVKCGAEGAVAWDGCRTHTITTYRAETVDPVGAGDAFAAGLLADLAQGAPHPQALDTAAAVAAVNVACHGDWEGLPTRAELELHRCEDIVR